MPRLVLKSRDFQQGAHDGHVSRSDEVWACGGLDSVGQMRRPQVGNPFEVILLLAVVEPPISGGLLGQVEQPVLGQRFWLRVPLPQLSEGLVDLVKRQ